MKILVINNGSTSFRFQLIDTDDYKALAIGKFEEMGTPNGYIQYKNVNGINVKYDYSVSNMKDAVELMDYFITDRIMGVIETKEAIDSIGYRVVHGGEIFNDSIEVGNSELEKLKELIKLMPLHGKNIIQTIEFCRKKYPNTKNIAVFDTTFHSSIPKNNFLYAIPIEFYENYGIRKYGFHGISYSSVLEQYTDFTGIDRDEVNTIICHMGGGSSMCAIKNGKSYDTTMEFTPLSGLIMSSRSGSIDPMVVTYLIKYCNMSVDEVINLLNNRSGYLAMCNEKDAKKIVERSLANDKDAIFLRRMINKNFKKHLLTMMANFDNVGSIILTGGMSAKNKEQREMFLGNLQQFGIKLDKQKNNQLFDEIGIISSQDSNIPIYVIPDEEEKQIAKECVKVLKRGI